MILKVGLTGGIASGKSTIANMFAALGCVVLDADALVADLYKPGRPGHETLVATYGSGILCDDGQIDRQKLADIAFADEASAKKLNALIHPLVITEEAKRANEAEAKCDRVIYIVEATLLLEAGGKQRYDKIIVVDVDPTLQVTRGVGRGMAKDEVERRIRHQLSREDRLRAADYVIENRGDLEAARREVQRVYESLQNDLTQKAAG